MRILKRLAALLGCLVVIVGVSLFALGRGWHVEDVSPGELSAKLRPHDEILKPEGEGPFQTVLIVPGCSGPRADHLEYARDFRRLGFASLIVDSNAHRGLDSTSGCGLTTMPWPAELAGDVLVSLDHARRMPFVDRERIVLAGWSSGASAILDLLAMDLPRDLPTNLASPPGGGLEGVVAVALFYPNCGLGVREAPGGWAVKVPSLFLLAGEESRVPGGLEACVELARRLSAAGQAAATQVYEGVGHAWDISDVAPGHTHVHVPEASADSRQQLLAFLAQHSR